MTIQTAIAQIKELNATHVKEMTDLYDRILKGEAETVPQPNTNPSELQSIVSGLLDIVGVNSLGNVKYMGTNPLDKFLARSYWEASQKVADALRRDFPDRKADKLEMVRACPGVYTKPDTHLITGEMADFHYFTFGETNHTQMGSFGQPLIEIWDEEGNLTDLFDAERTLTCMKMFKLIFPQFSACTVPKIKEAMGVSGRAYDYIGTDLDAPEWHHDTHWHGALNDGIHATEINKYAVI
jgi:hypothetical protein